MKAFNTEFYGTVYLKDWLNVDRVNTKSIEGNVSIHLKDSVDKRIENRDANWFARIASSDNTKSMNILGCQIRGISQHPEGVTFQTTNDSVII